MGRHAACHGRQQASRLSDGSSAALPCSAHIRVGGMRGPWLKRNRLSLAVTELGLRCHLGHGRLDDSHAGVGRVVTLGTGVWMIFMQE